MAGVLLMKATTVATQTRPSASKVEIRAVTRYLAPKTTAMNNPISRYGPVARILSLTNHILDDLAGTEI